MDMVGYRSANNPVPQVLLETLPVFSYLQATYIEVSSKKSIQHVKAASQYTKDGLQILTSVYPFGSDHVSNLLFW